jgi:protein-L-isoaspartate(D-aspartate) O-methyltransferase
MNLLLIDDQAQRAALVMLLRARGIRDLRVLNAFERMPRYQFLPEELAIAASRDSPLPLACGQTMERPSQAARVIEAMQIEPHHHVLEIGSGSGWLTGVLSGLAKEVTAYERYAELVRGANENLQRLGAENVNLIHGDGTAPKDNARFDRILLGASVEALPTGLTERLKENGELYAAIGRVEDEQHLTCFTKLPEGVRTKLLFPVWLPPLERGKVRAL